MFRALSLLSVLGMIPPPPPTHFWYAVMCADRAERGAKRLNFRHVFCSQDSCFTFQTRTSKWRENLATPADITAPLIVTAPDQPPAASSIWEEWEEECRRERMSGGQWSCSACGRTSDPGGGEDSQHSTALSSRRGLVLSGHTALSPRQHLRLDTHCSGLKLDTRTEILQQFVTETLDTRSLTGRSRQVVCHCYFRCDGEEKKMKQATIVSWRFAITVCLHWKTKRGQQEECSNFFFFFKWGDVNLMTPNASMLTWWSCQYVQR